MKISVSRKAKLRGGLNGLVKRAKLPYTRVDVGFQSGARYKDGTKVSSVALRNEKGLGVPARPFMRTTLLSGRVRYKRRLLNGLSSVLTGVSPAKLVLDRLGVMVTRDMRRRIIAWSSPPNAPSTVARKGFNDPLIHTRKMLNSVEYKVKR